MTSQELPLPAEAYAAAPFLDAWGCRHCQVRRRSTYGAVLEVCGVCAKVARGDAIGNMVLLHWAPISSALAGYLTDKTRLPWLCLAGAWAPAPSHHAAYVVARITHRSFVAATTELSWTGNAQRDTGYYFARPEVAMLLDVGVLLRRYGHNGKGPGKIAWPALLDLVGLDAEARAACAFVAKTTYDEGAEATYDCVARTQSFADFIRAQFPQVVGAAPAKASKHGQPVRAR